MKTLSEFFGKSLRTLEEQMPQLTSEATQAAQEALKAEGKSEEEIAASLPEAIQTALNAKLTELTKYEGDKVTWLRNAVQLVKSKKGNLKRVIVMQAAEGEKGSGGAQEIDGKFYAVEFFQEAGRPAEAQAAPAGKFGDKRGGGKGRGGKGAGDKGGRGAPGGGRGSRDSNDDRPRRQPAAAAAPGTGKTSPLIILNGTRPTGSKVIAPVAPANASGEAPTPASEG